MRLQVEITTASAIVSAAPTSSRMKRLGAAVGQREPLAHAPAARSCATCRARAARSSRHRLALGSSRLRVAALGELRQLADLALDARQLRRHDRHVDQDQRQEDEVGGRDVRARRRRAGARASELLGAAVRRERGRSSSSPASAALERAQLHRGVLGGQLVLPQRHEQHAMPASETRNVSAHRARHRAAGGARARAGASSDSASRTAMKFSGTNAPADDREHRGVARLALRVLDREAQRLVAGVEQEDDQERDQRRLVPHPPVAPRGLGPDRAR